MTSMPPYPIGYMSRSSAEIDAANVRADIPPNPLVSVVVTTYNSARYVEAAIESLLLQSHSNLEIIVVDDGSEDETRECVMRMQAKDARVRLLSHGSNRGTYWSKNFGITRARGAVITFADSDDDNARDRIQKQLDALRRPGAVVSTCNYQKRDSNGAVMPLASGRRFAFISQMMRKEVFDAIGFFDSVRTSADDEMLNRIRQVFGASSHVNVDEVLYTALVRDGSLSNNDSNPKYSEATGGLSPARAAYLQGFTCWHADLLGRGRIPYVPFPVVRRPFPIDPKLSVDRNGNISDESISLVLVGKADSEGDVHHLRWMNSQADTVHAWAGFEGSKELMSQVQSRFLGSGRGLAEALQGGELATGYVIFIDPVLRYSQWYVEHMVRAVEYYGRQAAVCAIVPAMGDVDGHGGISLPVYVPKDRLVASTAYGAVAFHTDLLREGKMEGVNGLKAFDAPLVETASAGALSVVSREAIAVLSRRQLTSAVHELNESTAEPLRRYLLERRKSFGSAFETDLLTPLVPSPESSTEAQFVSEPKQERSPVDVMPGSGSAQGMRGRLYVLMRSLGISLVRMWTRLELLVLIIFIALAVPMMISALLAWWRLTALFGGTLLLAIGMFAVFSARRLRLIHFPTTLPPELGIRNSLARTLSQLRKEIRWRRNGFMTPAPMSVGPVTPGAPVLASVTFVRNWGKKTRQALRFAGAGKHEQALSSLCEIEAGMQGHRDLPLFQELALSARALIFRQMGDQEASAFYAQGGQAHVIPSGKLGRLMERLQSEPWNGTSLENGLDILRSMLPDNR